MRIYVDFDDCLCETGRAFSELVQEMFNKHVPYDRIHYFELDRSFEQGMKLPSQSLKWGIRDGSLEVNRA